MVKCETKARLDCQTIKSKTEMKVEIKVSMPKQMKH